MRLERVHGRSPVLGPIDVRFGDGLVALVGRDARALGAFRRTLRRAVAGTTVGEAAAWTVLPREASPERQADLAVIRVGLGGHDDPTELFRASSLALARLRGGAVLDAAARRLGEGNPSTPVEEAASDELRRLESELRELRADHAEVAGDVEVATMAWLRERQDAETHLQAYRDRARELKARLSQLEDAGADSPCPTCRRVLGERFAEVVGELREEWESVVQDGSWWKRRREQLDLKPETLQEIESRSIRLQAAAEQCAEQVERVRVRLADGTGGSAEVGAADQAGGRRDAPDDEPVDARRGGEREAPVPETVARAIANLRRRLVLEAEEDIAERAGAVLARISGGRLLGFSRLDEELAIEGAGARVTEPTPEDAASAVVAIQLGAARAALADGQGLPGFLILGAAVDRLDEGVQLRTLELLSSLREGIPQLVVLSRGDLVDRCPEIFDRVLELRSGDQVVRGRDEGPPIRSLPSGIGGLRLVSSAAQSPR